MEDVVQKSDLLEFLYTETGCAFLSDLHCPEWLPQIKEIIQRLDENQFTAEQWLEAARYISCQKVEYVRASDIRQFLLDFITEA